MAARPSLPLGLCLLFASLLAGCAKQDNSPFPTDPGRWWYYQTRTKILKDVSEQRLLISNLARDQHSFQQRRQANWDHQFRFTDQGLVHQQYFNRGQGMGTLREASALVLPQRLAVGEAWTFTSALHLIESRTFATEDHLGHRPLPVTMHAKIAALDDTVRVPAGRYTGCIKVEASGETTVPTDRGNAIATVKAEQHEWYAPGVGLVRLTRKETADSQFRDKGEYTQELLQTDRH